jgi:tRNA_anti-like
MKNTKSLSIVVIGSILCLFAPLPVFSQTERLGLVQYTPPKGWTKNLKDNVVIFSDINEASGRFCVITLYGATPSAGTPQRDFAKEWNNLVVKPWNAETNPKTETQNADGWTAIAGGSAIDFQGNKAFAFLSVLSGFGKTVSVLGILNNDSYLVPLQAFVETMDIDKSIANGQSPLTERNEPAPPSDSSLTMHAAALVREFENNEIRANQTYIGKRVRITGTVNMIEINSAGQIVLTFKTSITTYRMARCYFPRSQSSRVSALNAHEQATVEGTVKGLGDGFDNSKAYLVLENCTVP